MDKQRNGVLMFGSVLSSVMRGSPNTNIFLWITRYSYGDSNQNNLGDHAEIKLKESSVVSFHVSNPIHLEV